MATVIPVGGATLTDGVTINSRNANNEITSATLVTSTKYVADYQFYHYSYMTSITLPTDLEEIGNDSFYACSSLVLTSLPSTLTTIKSYAFYGASSMSLTSLPNVTSVGISAFRNCASLTMISIPKVTTINSYVFRDCKNLSTVTLGSIGYTITSLSNSVFYNDTQVFTINVYTTGSYVDGFITNIRNGTSSAYNATIKFYASENTTYDSVSYNAGELMLTSTPA